MTSSPLAVLDPAAHGVDDRGERPAAGAVLGHLDVAGLAGGVGDGLGVLAHLVPRGRRLVGVEPGRLEHGPVVVQAHAVGRGRDGVDVAVAVLDRLQHVGVELVGVRQLLELGRDVLQLAALDQGRAVGEGDLEGRRQRVAGELRTERGDVPLPLLGVDGDVRVGGLELLDPGQERLPGLGLGLGRQVADADGHARRRSVAASSAASVVVVAAGGHEAHGQRDHQRGADARAGAPHVVLRSRVAAGGGGVGLLSVESVWCRRLSVRAGGRSGVGAARAGWPCPARGAATRRHRRGAGRHRPAGRWPAAPRRAAAARPGASDRFTTQAKRSPRAKARTRGGRHLVEPAQRARRRGRRSPRRIRSAARYSSRIEAGSPYWASTVSGAPVGGLRQPRLGARRRRG